MKKLQFLIVFTVFTASILIMGCKGDAGPSGPQGPAGNGLSGNLTGLVMLIDSNGTQPSNRSGVTVSIPGTFSSTTTDSTGKWQFSNLSSGTYEIDVTKPGFGMTKHLNQQFLGGGTLFIGNDFLSKTPSFSVALTSDSTISGAVKVKGTISGPSQTVGRDVLVFIGTQSTVSSNPANYAGVVTLFVSDTATVLNQNITTSNFSDAGIPSGSTCYIIAYPSSAPAANSSRYVDQVTGRFIYTSLGSPSAVLPVTTPNRVINNRNGQ